jgi:ABC-type multidrug transport system ATPase subunit
MIFDDHNVLCLELSLLHHCVITGGYIEGELRVGGHPKEQATFARIAGYVEQFDIHSPQTTVHEALQFSAALRLPSKIDAALREVRGALCVFFVLL